MPGYLGNEQEPEGQHERGQGFQGQHPAHHLEFQQQGGDQQFADITSLSDRTTKQVPTVRSAVTMNIGVYDDPSLTWYPIVTAASDASVPVALIMAFPNGSVLVANAYWSLQKVPTVGKNEALSTQISLSYAADPIRYAS